MQKAEYPQRTCREPIFGTSGMGYTCELADLHLGPHATFSDPHSVRNRNRWESENPDQVDQRRLDGDVVVDKNGRPIHE